MNFFTNFLFIVTMVAMFDEGMGSSILILKDYYIYMYMYVLNLIAIYSKEFFRILFNLFFCWFYPMFY